MTDQVSEQDEHRGAAGWEHAYASHAGTVLWQEAASDVIGDVETHMGRLGLKTVVDLGCGDGRNLLALAQAGFLSVGIDYSASALAKARARMRQAGVPCFLTLADVCRTGIADDSLDAAVCIDVAGHLPTPEELVGEVARVLVAGGLFIATFYTPNDSEHGTGEKVAPNVFRYEDTVFRFFTRAEVKDLFSDWDILLLEARSWMDPPHGKFRPYEHTHENWVVIAQAR